MEVLLLVPGSAEGERTRESDGTAMSNLLMSAWPGRFSVLTASVCTGMRSITVAVSACIKADLVRSQSLWEETFLRLCADRLSAAGVSAVWLCDRGFYCVGWLKLMVEMRHHFVVGSVAGIASWL